MGGHLIQPSWQSINTSNAAGADFLNSTKENSTVDADEIARFSAFSETWWDPAGKMGVLHKFNAVRLSFIRDTVAAHFGRDIMSGDTLKGLRLLDIGCGGGLLCEPMARLGA